MRKLILERAKEAVRVALDLPTTHMHAIRGIREMYVNDIGKLQIVVSPSEGFGTHDIGEYIQIDIVIPDDHWISLMTDWETFDRDLLAEQEYKNGER